MPTKKREIYAVRFNHFRGKEDLYFTEYQVGVLFLGRGLSTPKTPVKIELIKDDTRVLTTFSDGHSHEIGYEMSVELFWRDVEPKKKTNEKERPEKTV